MCRTKKRIRLIAIPAALILAGCSAGVSVPGSEGGRTANYTGRSAVCPSAGYDGRAYDLFGTLLRALLTYSGTTDGKGAEQSMKEQIKELLAGKARQYSLVGGETDDTQTDPAGSMGFEGGIFGKTAERKEGRS